MGIRLTNKWEDEIILKEFQKWIEKKYRINTTHSWADIIDFYSSDEYHALMKFFSEFKKFLEQYQGG